MTDRVLEIGHFGAGYCGRLFALAGYDVVRIETTAAAPGWVSFAASELYLHAGKRRIATADPALIEQLASRAQIVIAEAATADELAELGFDRWQAPVKVAITPFGRTGPKRNWQATPHVLLATGGYTQLMGDAERPPLSLPGHYLEFQAGQYAYVAANACRLAGTTSVIDIGMLETLMSLSQFTTIQWHCMGVIRSRHGNEFWTVCPTNLYRLQDGWAYVNIVPAFWDGFTLFLDRPELAMDERFLTNGLRMAHRDELNAIVGAIMGQLDKAEANRRAEAVRIPAGVVQSLDEVLDDPHLGARGIWQTIRAADGTRVRTPALPWRFNDLPHPTIELTEPEVGNG